MIEIVGLDDVPIEVMRLFEYYADQIVKLGFKRYSADAILHRIRWHMNIERGHREFKCNNNWTAPLSRWYMKKYPELEGFFSTRVRPTERRAGYD